MIELKEITAIAQIADILGQTPLAGGLTQAVVNNDGLITIRNHPDESKIRFQVNGHSYHALISRTANGTHYRFWAELGFIPYSAHSAEKRNHVLSVLRATQSLERVRFMVDGQQRVFLDANCLSTHPPSRDEMLYQIIQFIQVARPYLQLMAKDF